MTPRQPETTDMAEHAGGAAADSAGNGRGAGWYLRAALQVVGFAIGLGLLGWVVSSALSPQNQAQLARLADATPGQILLLLGLSVVVLASSAACFWISLLPVRRLRMADIQAVNAVAFLLNYLPFKLGLLTRVLVHVKRDRVPLLTVGAWMGATAVPMMLVFCPAVAVTLWRPTVDALWWGSVLSLCLGGATLVVVAATLMRAQRGWERVERIAARLRRGPAARLAGETVLERVHEGVRMLASPRAVAGGVAVRTLDVLAQAARFWVAAWVIGENLTYDQAVLAACVYTLIGAFSPTGVVGFREAGTAGIFTLLASESFGLIVLMVTATETMVVLIAGVGGALWLRVDRLIRLDLKNGGAE